MLCKKCGETFSDGYKACPHCGERKSQKKAAQKVFKVDLPEDIKPETETDNFISSNSKPAPHIEKVIVDQEQLVKNKTRNTRYIDNEAEQTIQGSTVDAAENKKAAPKKPVSTQELFSKAIAAKKSQDNKEFKIALPEEYAQLNLTVEKKEEPIKKDIEPKQKPVQVQALSTDKEQTPAQISDLELDLEKLAKQSAEVKQIETDTEPLKEDTIQLEIKRREKEFELALQSKKEEEKMRLKILPKKAMNTVLAMVMVLVVVLGSLTAISATTSWFEMSDEIVKSLSFISVKDEKVQEIEEFLTKIVSVLTADSFDSTNMSANEALDLIKPYSDSGVYANFFGAASLIYDNDDPASRFIQEGEGYYCISQEDIDEIFACLGINSISMAMQEQYYLYDGYYYFTQAPDDYVQSEYELTVSSVKSTLDGCYYVELSVNDLTNLVTYKRYVILSEEETDEGSSYYLDIISEDELFNSFGEMRVSSDDESSLYTIERETIELETSDGVIIYEYVIDYPVLSGDSNTIALINQLYSDLIASYKLSTEEVDNEYEIYQAAGVDEDIYPISVYIEVSVALYDEEYVSILQHVVEENSLIEPQEDIIVPLYETSMSSFNYVIESTHDLKISEVMGDYEDEFCEILYRMYYDYDYSTVLTGEYLDKPSWYYYGWEDDYDSTPSDSEGIGEDIYDSCFTLTADGVVFYYENEYGYYQEFFIDNDTIDTINSVYAVDEISE